MLTLMLGTGIRVSECVGLDLNDVDFKNNGIKIHRKGGYESIVYFGEEVEKALFDYMQEREKIIPKEGSGNALFLSMQKTALYQESGDIYLVADVLGHKDVNTTRKHYAAQADERRRQAAKMVRLREQ